MTQRINKISSLLTEKLLDALIVTSDINVSYLSGFDLGDAILLFIPGKTNLIITDPRFITEANSIKGFKAEITSEKIPIVLARKLKEYKLKKVAFEAQNLSFKQYQLLKEACADAEWIPTDGLIEKMRSIKDQSELNKIKKAVEIAAIAFETLLKELRPGLTEKMIADRLEFLLRERGGQKSAFDIIVASADNTSHPHARAGERRWKEQDSLLIDWGANFQGYNCDLTRMLFSDRITVEKKRIYKILCEVQEKAISSIKAGVKAKELDRNAHKLLKKHKLDRYLLHSLGHGIGKEVHESPWISIKSPDVLEENMVFTVEPAVYFPDEGMRIEDMVVVTKDGCEVLSKKLNQVFFL